MGVIGGRAISIGMAREVVGGVFRLLLLLRQ